MKLQGKCQREEQRSRWGQHIREAVAQKEARIWEGIEKQLRKESNMLGETLF
jgi:hypothetical protein